MDFSALPYATAASVCRHLVSSVSLGVESRRPGSVEYFCSHVAHKDVLVLDKGRHPSASLLAQFSFRSYGLS